MHAIVAYRSPLASTRPRAEQVLMRVEEGEHHDHDDRRPLK